MYSYKCEETGMRNELTVDGYGRLDAGLFVEAAEAWKQVKPQAWFDSPAVYLPTLIVNPPAPEGGDDNVKRQDVPDETVTVPEGESEPLPEGEQPIEGVEEPAYPMTGSTITPEGISSTFEVTQGMLEDSNFETMEHVTVRVWIDHQRRGDVEVEIKSPGGVTSVLARQRRFDEADTGFPGWKFMSLKHW
jgi:kexin